MRHKPKKSLGQNFLIDRNIRAKIVAACHCGPRDTVIEIGPGRGELTALIASGVRRLVAIEIDRLLIPGLQTICAEFPHVQIIQEDILTCDLKRLIPRDEAPITVVGNIPYYISTPIIARLIEYKTLISDIFLTVQKEFAERIVADPGSKTYGALSCFVQYHTQPAMLFSITKTCFRPKPKVDSAFLRLSIKKETLLQGEMEERMFKLIRAAFTQRRKTLRKSLFGIVAQDNLDEFFLHAKFDRNIRPEDLSINDFALLARICRIVPAAPAAP
jgi:16S rRNA (adenine1518-N6/adenine1519-N6)-dimethyltransferase